MQRTQSLFRMGLAISMLVSGMGGGGSVLAAPSEPAYCDPSAFDERELKLGDGLELERSGLNRVHAFKLGKVTLVGVGVGNSKASALKELEQKHSVKSSSTLGKSVSNPSPENKFCTFYLNHPKGDGNDGPRLEASKAFNHKDIIPNPSQLTEDVAAKEFMAVIEKTFDRESTNFLSCAQEDNYIALGCNGMMHRGPTVFGMVLAFSGCTPEHALEVANQTWGLNGVKRKVRLAVIKKAYELGSARPESRKKLADLFSSP